MRARLLRLHSPDTPDLEAFEPSDPENFEVLIQAMIGPINGRGEESFSVIVCTPEWLSRRIPREEYLWGRGYLVLRNYSYPVIRRAVERLVASVEGEDWQQVAQQLARFTRWEFDDYRE